MDPTTRGGHDSEINNFTDTSGREPLRHRYASP